MKICTLAAAIAFASGMTGSALAASTNSTSGHAIDRANFERSLSSSPHPHQHNVAADERYTRSTEAHSKDRDSFYSALPDLGRAE